LAHLIEKKFVKKWCSLVMLGTLQERLHFPVLQNKVSTPKFQHPCSFKEEIHKKITKHDDPISFENCGAYYLPMQTRFRTTPPWPEFLLDMECEPAQIPTPNILKYYHDSTDQALSISPKLVHPDGHQQTQATTDPCL
jgi:hypothetical protein